jgi:hypothetical protein
LRALPKRWVRVTAPVTPLARVRPAGQANFARGRSRRQVRPNQQINNGTITRAGKPTQDNPEQTFGED